MELNNSKDPVYLFIKSAMGLMAKFPLRYIDPITSILSGIFAPLGWSRKRVATTNLSLSFPHLGPMELKRLYRSVLRHFLAVMLELPHLATMPPEEMRGLYTMEGKEHVLEALESQRGLLLLTAHFGNWELLNLAFALEFHHEPLIIVRPLDNKALDRAILEIRTRFGSRPVDKHNASKEIFRALKNNTAVGILLDQNVDWYQGVFVRFFGRWACANKGLALISLKTGSPVIPAFTIREKGPKYTIVFERPLSLIRTGDKTMDVEENTALFTRIIEDYVRKYPEQWFWFHRRWKARIALPLEMGHV